MISGFWQYQFISETVRFGFIGDALFTQLSVFALPLGATGAA